MAWLSRHLEAGVKTNSHMVEGSSRELGQVVMSKTPVSFEGYSPP